jgi:3-oxoacyl-[acyl-carrier protein] reductase
VTGDAGTAVIFGARRLGRDIAAHLADAGWRVLAVARTPETIAALTARRPDIAGRVADAGDAGAAACAIADAASANGSVDLVVNAIADPAVSAAALSREADTDASLRTPLGVTIEPVRNVIDAALAQLRSQGHGTLIQITGGLALRARRGTAALAATGYATRALIEGSIAEARDDGVHVALLVVRGLIESDLTADLVRGQVPGASMTATDVAAAVDFLIAQREGRAWTHELTLTPPAAAWD